MLLWALSLQESWINPLEQFLTIEPKEHPAAASSLAHTQTHTHTEGLKMCLSLSDVLWLWSCWAASKAEKLQPLSGHARCTFVCVHSTWIDWSGLCVDTCDTLRSCCIAMLRFLCCFARVVFPAQQKYAPLAGKPALFIGCSSEWGWRYRPTGLPWPSQRAWLLTTSIHQNITASS